MQNITKLEIHYIFYRNETQNRDEYISARIGWSNSKYSKYPPFRFRKYRSKSNSSAENRRFGNFTLATSVNIEIIGEIIRLRRAATSRVVVGERRGYLVITLESGLRHVV